jgi:hypothetical protein
MRGAVPPLPQYVFMAWCLVKHGDSFTFAFTYVDTNRRSIVFHVINIAAGE